MVVEVSSWQVKVIDQDGKSGWINFFGKSCTDGDLIPLTPTSARANMQV